LKQVEKKAEDNLPPEYRGFLSEVKERIRNAQYAALKAVNVGLVTLYWDIGQMIVELQEQAAWGKSVVEHLSRDLRREFPGIAGFSVQNLWYMSQFFREYDGQERLQPLVGEIAWAHNLVIMAKCKDPLEREFYLRMTRKFGWTKNVLAHSPGNCRIAGGSMIELLREYRTRLVADVVTGKLDVREASEELHMESDANEILAEESDSVQDKDMLKLEP